MSRPEETGPREGRSARAYALAMIAVFLGLQIAAQSLDRGSFFYPFVAYPMYATAHQPGETLRYSELRLVDREPEMPASRPRARSLGIPNNIYTALRAAAMQQQPTLQARGEDGAARMLAQILAARSDPRFARAEIWSRELRMGEEGLENPDLPWTLARSFDIPRENAK